MNGHFKSSYIKIDYNAGLQSKEENMANRKPLHLFFGIVLVILGAAFGLLAARAFFQYIRARVLPGSWFAGGMVLYILLGAFCVWIGANEFRRATGQIVRKPKFRWGRLLAGAYFVFFSLSSHFAPSSNSFKAENDAQAFGMLISTILMVSIGLVLMALAFKPRKMEVTAEMGSQADEGLPSL
jgi:hypothetical protein